MNANSISAAIAFDPNSNKKSVWLLLEFRGTSSPFWGALAKSPRALDAGGGDQHAAVGRQPYVRRPHALVEMSYQLSIGASRRSLERRLRGNVGDRIAKQSGSNAAPAKFLEFPERCAGPPRLPPKGCAISTLDISHEHNS